MELYGPALGGNPHAIVAAMITDEICTEPARFVAQLHAQRGAPVYRYQFAYVPEALRSRVRGAGHASEQQFVFGNLLSSPARPVTYTDADRETADMVGRYWTNFARTGDPNGSGLARWPRDGADELLRFTADGPRAEAGFLKARLDLWARLAAAG